MPRYLIKVDDDKYINWSTIVDAPTTYIMTKKEAEDFLIFEYGNSVRCQMESLFERADKRSLNDEVYNRAGENEKCLTADQIIERYTWLS